MRKLSSELFAVFIACFLTFLFFLPPLVSGRIPIPADSILGLYHPWRDLSIGGYNPGKFPTKNPLITDPVLQGYPWRFLIIKNIKLKNLPLWNPYSFSGQPLLANIQSAPFLIFNVFFLLLPFKVAWSIQAIAPSVLTSLFMFWFLKNKKVATPSAIFGSLILPFSGFFMAWLTWGTIVSTVMWLPLILLCTDKLFTRRDIWRSLILIFAISQTILSGHWQAASYVLLASILYSIYNLQKSKNFKSALFFLVLLTLGIIISSVQILPSLEFIKYSARNIDQGFNPKREDWFLPPAHLFQLIAPDFFGNPATYNYWGIWNYAEFVSFIGIVPLSLALFAFLKRARDTKFFILLSLVSLLFAIKNPLSIIPYSSKFPYVSTMQPSRIVFLLDFSLAVLAAYGLDFFLKEKSKLKIIFPPVIILVFLTSLAALAYFQNSIFPQGTYDTAHVALRNLVFPLITILILIILTLLKLVKIQSSFIIAAIFLLTAVELFRFGYKFTPFSQLSWIFPKTATLEFLQKQEKPFRVMSTDRRILHPNTQAIYTIESIDGYDPLYLERYAHLVSVWQQDYAAVQTSSFNRIITPQKYDSKFADLLNVKYVLSFDEIQKPNLVKVFTQGETKVYENKNALPRAFFANEIVRVSNDQEELKKLLDRDFDLTKSATSQDLSFNQSQHNARVNFTQYSDQSFSLTTQTDDSAPLVISNIFYPGWQATIDGRKTQVYRADYTLQAIMVPQGSHTIEFKFKPQSFYNGLYISMASLAIIVILEIFIWKRKYQ